MNDATILVVEDNPTLQKLVGLMAKRRGVTAVVAGSCAEAIRAVEQNPNGFALVLMDLSLPDSSGIECTAVLKDILLGETPVVAMTGHAMPGDREACLDSGMDDYLCKPFTFEQFTNVLSKWMTVEHIPLSSQQSCSSETELGA